MEAFPLLRLPLWSLSLVSSLCKLASTRSHHSSVFYSQFGIPLLPRPTLYPCSGPRAAFSANSTDPSPPSLSSLSCIPPFSPICFLPLILLFCTLTYFIFHSSIKISVSFTWFPGKCFTPYMDSVRYILLLPHFSGEAEGHTHSTRCLRASHSRHQESNSDTGAPVS